jgi:hypothetical protein
LRCRQPFFLDFSFSDPDFDLSPIRVILKTSKPDYVGRIADGVDFFDPVLIFWLQIKRRAGDSRLFVSEPPFSFTSGRTSVSKLRVPCSKRTLRTSGVCPIGMLPLSCSNNLLPIYGRMAMVLPTKALAGKLGCLLAIYVFNPVLYF